MESEASKAVSGASETVSQASGAISHASKVVSEASRMISQASETVSQASKLDLVDSPWYAHDEAKLRRFPEPQQRGQARGGNPRPEAPGSGARALPR